ncbi:RICIN domain-containing protein [Streptantibioticus ferralitis]|uniref:Ricin B lectin domain-containing protein n=1 Tax=Streptantibioticus ferralitis TaxID=236510 RepID=A0ABT5Z995_9ACTN|nr:hypothetical protein [Streptantibioticus ferralitis]MDF2260411.1 hypothetical protein [Streptantibioticus ferralitis]
MKFNLKSAVGAGVLALGSMAGLLATAGTAQANTYQYSVQLKDQNDGQCLDSNNSGDLYVLNCNGGNYQRWDVTSYAGNVGNYYDRVQIRNRQTGRCLRVDRMHMALDPVWSNWHYVGKTGSCDYQDWHDQWNLTWVGNTNPNPNSYQFANYQQNSDSPKILCLDRGQAGHWNNMLYDLGAPSWNNTASYTCSNHSNTYQTWSMVS